MNGAVCDDSKTRPSTVAYLHRWANISDGRDDGTVAANFTAALDTGSAGGVGLPSAPAVRFRPGLPASSPGPGSRWPRRNLASAEAFCRLATHGET